ncbi:MAG: hypothetical protein ACRDQY_24560 [Pseudonocardiaceae bacterium]
MKLANAVKINKQTLICGLLSTGACLATLILPSNPAMALPAVPVFAPLVTQVTAVSAPMTNTSGTATTAVAGCPAGTKLVGGGLQVGKATPATTTPVNGLKVNGTYPSDAGATPITTFAVNPTFWAAAGGFGSQSEASDQVTSFAVCATVGPLGSPIGVAVRLVAVASINGPTTPLTTAAVTATCPTGTELVGGGASGTPASSKSFKPIGSFPSNSNGTMVPDGTHHPQSWTAVGSAGGMANPANVTTAFAVCSAPPLLPTTVVRVNAPGPQVGSTFVTVPATCSAGSQVLSGGVNVDNSSGPLQEGVHLRGSYPSDIAGNPVSNGKTNATTWTGIVQAGGQPTPNTAAHVFAICAR